MNKIPAFVFSEKRFSLLRRLLSYMLLLVLFAALLLWSCQAIFGQFATTYDSTRQLLSTHLDYYELHVKEHYERLAADGISLSKEFGEKIDDFLRSGSLAFDDLTDRPDTIFRLESRLYTALEDAVQSADNSGAFFFLDVTANSRLENSEKSRSGVYLRAAGKPLDRSITLFRGSADFLTPQRLTMHNKWTLEFNLSIFPDYSYIRSTAALPVENSYYFTQTFRLPGTWEQVQLLTVPIFGKDGSFYGFCGFEVSEHFFKSFHRIPSVPDHLSCFITDASETNRNGFVSNVKDWTGTVLDPQSGMISGTTNGYYIDINELLTVSEMKPGLASKLRFDSNSLSSSSDSGALLKLQGDSDSYVGMCRAIRLSPLNGTGVAAVCIPESDYTVLQAQRNISMIVILLLFGFFGLCACIIFSRRFLKPILFSLETMRSKESDWKKSNITEIDDLMDFLEASNRQTDAALAKANSEISVLRSAAASNRDVPEVLEPIDPERLQFFLASLDTLSPAERRVFDLYVQGYKSKEISEKLCLSINTIKTHNSHIFDKLAVSSRKELLLFIRHMQQAVNANDNENEMD